MTELIITNIIAPVIAAIVAYILGHKKGRVDLRIASAEAEVKHLEATDQAVGIWQKTTTALQESLIKTQTELSAAKQKIDELEGMIRDLQNQLSNIKN